ncbi:MAG: iron-containing alcohol dehydrogenase [Mariprofundaceae bacterium]|nr:iron-containing alcohol dehydrogenase [Mariprofundaceae bacterium]
MNFSFATVPPILFGAGEHKNIPSLCATFGSRVLIVRGGASFDQSEVCQKIRQRLEAQGQVTQCHISGEPSPSIIDESVQKHRNFHPDVILAVGGGSVIDAAKAIAGLLPCGHSVLDYLEGVGAGHEYHGPCLPWIAVPTTAGTGSETSKNAVLSQQGLGGYKKSFRSDQLIAHHIVMDPELHISCPAAITAACGMDAFTQLLESYVSTRANTMSDALAWNGMEKAHDHLLDAFNTGQLESRSGMAYASMLSGITLANVGLGSVHGLASPLGAFFPIPHGVVCGTLVGVATRINIEAMQHREPQNPALQKYAKVGRLLSDQPRLKDEQAHAALIAILDDWIQQLHIPRLSEFQIQATDIDQIVAGSRGNSMQTNPIELTDAEIHQIVRECL